MTDKSKNTVYKKILLALIVLWALAILPSTIESIWSIGNDFGYNVTKFFLSLT